MATRQEEAETIAQLASYAVSDKDVNGGGNGLFWDSRRVLLGVSSGADISIAPRELELSIDRQDASKSKSRGEFIIRNTAVKGDELVYTGINLLGRIPGSLFRIGKKATKLEYPGEASTFEVSSRHRLFQDKPNVYKLTLEFKHNK